MKHALPFRFLLLLLALGLADLAATAQTAERRTSIGLLANGLQYQGSTGSDYWQWDKTRLAPGIAINQYLSRSFDLNTQAFYGEVNGRRSAVTYFNTTLINVNVGLKVKLNNGWVLKENALIQPYLLASTGWTYANRIGLYDTARIDLDKGYVDIFGAAGFNVRLGRVVSLFVQTGQHLPLDANFDGRPTGQETSRLTDRFMQHTVGLTFNLGQAADADEDGVPDYQDKCSNTPEGVGVSPNGCPRDGDNDGVPDYLDNCPTEAGTVELRGCPDKDNDGITDDEDNCPDLAGKAELRGCPDSDNDGVVDQDDKCPETPEGKAVDATGCPVQADPGNDTVVLDSDADGVPNAQDRCPNSAGPATNGGCPDITAAIEKSLRDATQSIRFELNRATLLPSSYQTLDALIPVLNQYPDHVLSIVGHTDSKGSAAFNLILSRERASAARSYLLSKGIAENRIALRGYGAQHPIADNATDAGRARNRRVEFELYVATEPNSAEAKYGPEPSGLEVAAPVPAPKSAAPKARPARRARPAVRRPAAAPAKAAPAARRPAKAVKARKSRKAAANRPTERTATNMIKRLGMPQH